MWGWEPTAQPDQPVSMVKSNGGYVRHPHQLGSQRLIRLRPIKVKTLLTLAIASGGCSKGHVQIQLPTGFGTVDYADYPDLIIVGFINKQVGFDYFEAAVFHKY